MALPIQTTLLSAVNVILRMIQEAPVSSLSPPFTDDVGMALETLNEVQVEFLGRAFTFNSESCLPLVLDTDGKYAIPTNVLRIVVERPHCVDLVPRDDAGTFRLYDRKNHTFVLPEGIRATFVYTIEFDSMPEPARRYVTIRAARTYQARLQGGQAVVFSQLEEIHALKAMKDYEIAVHQRNAFQNWAVARVVDREYPDTWRAWGSYRRGGNWR